MDDVLVIIITQTSAQLLVIHLWLVLSRTPATGDLLGVDQFELPLSSGPRNAILTVTVSQQLQQKLPQLDGPRARGVSRSDLWGGARAGRGIGAVHWRMERRGTRGGHWGAGGRGVRGGAVREGGAARTVEGVRRRLEQATVSSEGSRVSGEIMLGGWVMDGNGRGRPRRAGQRRCLRLVADHGVEGDIKVKVLEDKLRLLIGWS